MADPRDDLITELLAERFGPKQRPTPDPEPGPTHAELVAERQRLLAHGVDGRHLVVVDDRDQDRRSA